MLILAFDTSAAHCAVALMLDNRVIAEAFEPMTKGQAERLMPICEEVIAQGGYAWADLDCIGVGIGPGNFTGIRIAVSAARGLALSLDIPAIGISALDALAHGQTASVLATIDARQDKLYAQIIGAEPSLPQLTDFESLPTGADLCIGFQAEEIASKLNAKTAPPAYPIAQAIGRIALDRFGTDTPRPAPLYIRAPDAAPPRDTAPEILDA